MSTRIRLVLFDALHTLITPRLPIYVQYSQTFQPYLGALEPDALKKSFKTALKEVQKEKPAFQSGAREWWGEVIKRTAIGAGADPSAVDESLEEITCRLIHRFRSREGYRLFDDSLPTLRALREMGIRTGVVSNTDSAMRAALEDLEVLPQLDSALFSGEEGVEKPAREIFVRACNRIGAEAKETLHVGDELRGDYYGARDAGLSALLLRRPGPEGDGEAKEPDEDLRGIHVIPDLLHVVTWVRSVHI